MKLKELRTWVILIAALLLVLGFVGYRHYTRVKQVTTPAGLLNSSETNDGTAQDDEQTAVNVGYIDFEYLRANHPKVVILDQLDDQIRSYLKEQGQEQAGLDQNKKQVEAQYSDTNVKLSNRMEEIRAGYQKKIDARVQELQQELSSFESDTWKAVADSIQRKRTDLQAMAQQITARYQENQLDKLAEAEKNLRAQYTPQMLNISLKLQLVQLSDDEKKKYNDQLEKFQVELDQKVQDLRENIQAETNQFIQTKAKELDQELLNFQNQAKADAEKALEAKQVEMKDTLQAYIQEMQKQMQEEISVQTDKFQEQTKNGLTQAQDTIQYEIQQNDQLLRSKIDDARQEQDQIMKEIDDEITTVAKQIAKEKGLDSVVMDVRSDVKVVDLTDLVLSRIKK